MKNILIVILPFTGIYNIHQSRFITFTATDPNASIPQSPFPEHQDVLNVIVSMRSSVETYPIVTTANRQIIPQKFAIFIWRYGIRKCNFVKVRLIIKVGFNAQRVSDYIANIDLTLRFVKKMMHSRVFHYLLSYSNTQRN